MGEQRPYKLRVPDYLVDLIRIMHPRLKKKVRQALGVITLDPTSGKQLQKELAGLQSYRIGKFRIIYQLTGKKEIQLVAIGPRKNIYVETYRLIKRESKSK